MMIFLTVIHVLVCAFLVAAVLLQSGKGGGLAGSIGGGMSSGSVLGGRTASNFLTKATGILAVTFMLSCLFQSLASDNTDGVPTTATERMLQQRASEPVPFSAPAESGQEGGGLLPGSEEAAPAAEGDAATE